MEETAIEVSCERYYLRPGIQAGKKRFVNLPQRMNLLFLLQENTVRMEKCLFDIVKSVNPHIHFIEDMQELNPEWFNGIETVGITGATSTPQWLMEQVKDKN